MAEWLRSLTTYHFAFTAMGSNSARNVEFFRVRSFPARLRNVGVSYHCPLVPNIMLGGHLRSSSVSKSGKPKYDITVLGQCNTKSKYFQSLNFLKYS
jgi:hypothetical protein